MNDWHGPEPDWDKEMPSGSFEDDLRTTNLELVNLAKQVEHLCTAVLELVRMLPDWTEKVSRQTAETVVTAALGGYRVDKHD